MQTLEPGTLIKVTGFSRYHFMKTGEIVTRHRSRLDEDMWAYGIMFYQDQDYPIYITEDNLQTLTSFIMNATATQGIWRETINPDTVILFDTTRNPERITIQCNGKNPVHFEFEDGIGEKEIEKAMKTARESVLTN